MIKHTFNFRVGRLELKSCDESLRSLKFPHTTAEIVMHEPDSQFAIGFWQYNENRFNFCFCGNWPLHEDVDKDMFWMLVEVGQKMLVVSDG